VTSALDCAGQKDENDVSVGYRDKNDYNIANVLNSSELLDLPLSRFFSHKECPLSFLCSNRDYPVDSRHTNVDHFS